ncbi:unnamed protein product [Nyctereutes procyonoides]|uniref:(raccoon dog) hypothetical protein n=1 Tax=Nyctereutes procyonoides TaxID=34880 RepID=A0A811YGB0_NYCPR|nr:unnamed protein product [Nyctereutes procyonoides]
MAIALKPGEPAKGKPFIYLFILRFYSWDTWPFKLLRSLDVENIPRAWNLILYGLLGSVMAGLGHFLLTIAIEMEDDKWSSKMFPSKHM